MFSSLSTLQKEIVFKKSGRFVVRACPGSGKTYSVAARLAYRLSRWNHKHQGIATISFTNAAWMEIASQLENKFNLSTGIQYPHFLGTIDSFVNKNIFLPFGHHVLRCQVRPQMVGEPLKTWHGRNWYQSHFCNVCIDINGNKKIRDATSIKNDQHRATNISRIEAEKDSLLRMGYASQHDANYFAMRILETYPYIAKSLIFRYPVLIIDEAQDTSAVQMKIIDLLIQHGLQEIMLVGDPDQAIFEWNEAMPHLFNEKHESWKGSSIQLNENRRSSQKICDCTCKLSSLSSTSVAVNDVVRDYPIAPQVWVYSKDSVNDVVDHFISMCQENDIAINIDSIAVIARSKEICALISGATELSKDSPWDDGDYYAKDLSRGKYLFDRGDIKKGFKLVEEAYVKLFKSINICKDADIDEIINKIGFTKHRKEIFNFLAALPNCSRTIGAWIDCVNSMLPPFGITNKLKVRNKQRNATFEQIFGSDIALPTERPFRVGTVHSVKGETFEAVLLFLKKKGGLEKHYKTLLQDEVAICDSEELRIVYVGITRPRKLLVIAVPDEDNKRAWESKLLV